MKDTDKTSHHAATPPPPPVHVEPEGLPVEIRAWKPRAKKPAPQITIRTIRDVILLGITIMSAVFVYRQVTKGNLSFDRLAAMLAAHTQSAPAPDPVPLPPDRQRAQPRDQYRSLRTPLPTRPDESQKSPPESDLPDGQSPQRNGTLAPLLEEKPKAPLPAPVATIPLSEIDGRMMIELPTDSDISSLMIAAADGFPRSMVMLPSDGNLANGGKAELCLFGDKSVYLIVQVVEPAGEPPQLLIEVKTELNWIRGERLTVDRLMRKRKGLIDFLNAAVIRRNAASSEVAQLSAYIQSSGPKPLAAVGNAKNRIIVLEAMAPRLNGQVELARQQVTQFDQFRATLAAAFKNASLSINENKFDAASSTEIEQPIAGRELGLIRKPARLPGEGRAMVAIDRRH